ncbi:MAG: BrxA family protein [Methylococcales bacterium]
MPPLNNLTTLGKYDTTINIIGGISDCELIYSAIDVFFESGNAQRDLATIRNELNLRTQRSKVRVELAVRRSFLEFYNLDHQELIRAIFKQHLPLSERALVLFWQFALNNRLFREISLHVYIKAYSSGRSGLTKDDIAAYIKESVSLHKAVKLTWSESTINTLSSKYLNIMTKLNFVEGKRIKSFKSIRPNTESLCLFLYLAKLYDAGSHNILTNELLPLSFMPNDDLKERLKKLSMKGYFNMDFNGVALNIELTHSYKGICDVLYKQP